MYYSVLHLNELLFFSTKSMQNPQQTPQKYMISWRRV